MEFEHNKFGKCVLKELTQKEAEDYGRKMQELSEGPKEPLTVYRGNMVRVFSEFGFMKEPKLSKEDVDNSSPGLIKWLSDCITKAMTEALNIDPLS